MPDWFSVSWFSYATLREFEWAESLFLYLLPGIPVLFGLRWLFHNRSRQRLAVAFLARDLRTGWVEYLRYLPALLTIAAMLLLLLALARPQRVSQRIERTSEGIDIVLTLDVSESMLETDLAPTRLEAAKRVARAFVRGRPEDRMGLVVFAGDAFSLCPLTTDHELVQQSIGEINGALIRTAGTAIGSALGVSINRLRESKAKSKVIVLLSDGDNTAGSLDPVTAAQLAQAFNIRLYTIAVGQGPPGGASVGRVTGTAPIDEGILSQLAQIGAGQFFRATDTRALETIFARIDRLERAAIRTSRYREVQDFYFVYLNWAILLLLSAFLIKTTFIGNVLED
ncbi:MAG: VWA domain-containing protein [Sphingobacteriaceae bacterium]|nr:VWA domain-containing protein [Cytophagaceae bacterium]